MSKRSLDNYVPVNERLMEARGQHGIDMSILTEVTFHDIISPIQRADGTYIEVKGTIAKVIAAIFVKGTKISNGHSVSTDISDNKAVEKAETVAIGRALAMAGYSPDAAIASAEEMEDVLPAAKTTKQVVAPKATIQEPVEDYETSESSDYPTEEEARVPQAATATKSNILSKYNKPKLPPSLTGVKK